MLKLGTLHTLIVTFCVGVTNFFWLPVMGAWSDRIGRRPILIALHRAYPGHGLPGA